MKSAKPKLPKYIWADYDPEYPRDVRWSFYRTLSEQRGNRPESEVSNQATAWRAVGEDGHLREYLMRGAGGKLKLKAEAE